MASKNISFSVVMTCYNLENYVAEAIESVLRQKYDGEKELIIVDDCSTDGSMQVIRQTLARGTNGWQATVIQTERNSGVAGACDAGWARARYEWIIMADGDDIQDERRLELTNALVQRHPDAVMLVGSANYADINGNVYGYVGCCGMPYEQSPESSLLNTPEERLGNYLLPDGAPRWAPFGCYMAMRRSVFMRWGELTKSAGEERILQDSTWYLRALLTGPLLNSREPVCKYRTRENNILNRMQDGSTLKGCLAYELHMTSFYRLNVKNYHQELRDIQRAMKDATLTDLSTEQLQQLEAHVSSKLASYEILADWWNLPWGKRLCIALHNPLPANFSRWPLPRLLPFRVYVFLRWARQKMKG
ncbi:MAG: glycosyltransferase family A protein [Akkermansia sp.]|nr:glycosyltransferase family A protein [Akkermansia sp.]